MPTIDENAVFINMPYKEGKYERIFVSYIAALISIGRTPHCTVEIPENARGRLKRISDLLEICRVSIHDLSYVTMPVRFNIPFELGLAHAISEYKDSHDYILIDSKPYRIDISLSDIKGRDPYVHGGTMIGAVKCVLNALSRPGQIPEINRVHRMAVDLWQAAEDIKRNNHEDTIFNRISFHLVVSAGVALAVDRGFIESDD